MGFIYRNKNNDEMILTQRNIKVLKIDGISSLNNEINTTIGVNQSGETYVSDRVDTRDIDIKLLIRANENEYSVIKRKLMKLFNPALEGELILKSVNGDKKIATRVKVSPDFKRTSYVRNKEVEISLIALDPYWKDANETIIKIENWRSSFYFPLVIPEEGTMLGYKEPSLIANAKNFGDDKTGMKIEFRALKDVVNPELFNIETRDYIKINKTMTKGEIITITTDFGNKRVYSNNDGVIENAFNYLDLYSTFLQLEIGDNILRYNAESGLDSLEVSIYYSSRYVGV